MARLLDRRLPRTVLALLTPFVALALALLLRDFTRPQGTTFFFTIPTAPRLDAGRPESSAHAP